ncbi:MAG: hypothetical protein V4687_02510 [Bacteroidota bacterium]
MSISRFISPITEANNSNIFLLEVEFGNAIRVSMDCEIDNAIRLMFMYKIAMLPVYEGEELLGVLLMKSLPVN